MFERYTESSRRVIFFARFIALSADSTVIYTNHLLDGLLIELRRNYDDFGLRELLHTYAVRLDKTTKRHDFKTRDLPLTDDLKKVLAYTGHEANVLQEYLINPEHLVLGILSEESSPAAIKLREVGLEVETCRRHMKDIKDSRPRRRQPFFSLIVSPKSTFGVALQVAFLLGIILAMFLLRN